MTPRATKRSRPTRTAARPSRSAVLILNWRDTSHPEGGGSEVYVERIAAGLVERGATVTLLCARPDDAAATELRDGYRIVRKGGRFTVYLWAALYVLLGRRGPLGAFDQIVEVQNGMPFLARLYTRRPVTVLVHHVHREQWPVVMPTPLAQIGWFFESQVAPRVNRRVTYVTVSESSRDELVGLGVRRASIQLVHNGSSAPPSDVAVVDRSAAPSVVVLGRLVPHKRVELALDAVAALLPDVPDLEIHVIGQGWWEPHLREHAARLELGSAVTFHGFVDEHAKHVLLAHSWVLAMPSLKEGWGLVVIEAAQHHTPAVAFEGAGGLSESIDDGVTGVLVRSEEAFTAAVRAVLTDRALRDELGGHAAAASSRYAWSTAADAFAQVLGIRANGLIDLMERSGQRVP